MRRAVAVLKRLGELYDVIDVAREPAIGVVIIVHAERNLLEIVRALGAAGCFTGGLNCRQEQRDEDADDGNDH
jgi:hypothetical protein